ncbi:sensor histidine kinase [Vibrio sp. NH-7]
MMVKRKKSRSIFTYLYLTGVVSILGTITLFTKLTDGYMLQGDIDSFVESSAIHVKRYLETKGEPDGLYERLNSQDELVFYNYTLSLVDNSEVAGERCKECVMLVSDTGPKVYVRDDDYFSSALPIPNSDKFLLLTEIEEPSHTHEEWYEDEDTQFFTALFTLIGLVIGLLIYTPLVMINRRVKKLLHTQRVFGQGDLSVRAEPSALSPMKEIAESFNYMADDIEARVKQAQIFSYAIPHEIRTPLTRIQMASDLLRREDTVNKNDLFDQIDRYIGDISQLTSDILKLAKLTNQHREMQLEPTRFSLVELCQDRIQSIAEPGSATLAIQQALDDPKVYGCDCYAKLVLDNLIKNANKYGKGKVEVSIEQDQTCYLIHVEDNGEGIPEEKQEEIFIAFSRLDASRNLNQGGFGLGLAIANQAAKNLGWRLAVSQSPLGGAKFSITIPKVIENRAVSTCTPC